MSHLRDQARQAYADALVKSDHRLTNVAHTIRHGGFSNLWIDPALDAIERLMRAVGSEAADDPDEAPEGDET